MSVGSEDVEVAAQTLRASGRIDRMSDGVFYLSTGELVSMMETPYDAEDVLQELIERHPDLLAGRQMDPRDPRRWLLVKREHAVPDREGASGRWSVDHLFVDRDAVPTLVEVKRSSDTRIRREVVGQMLDYAANGVRFWPAETLQTAFEATARASGADPAAEVVGLRGSNAVVESLFDEVETNLRAGRIRMVFVADKIPDELRRIVEFLNEQMSQAEVFAIEVKQYRAQGRPDSVIVPTLIGRTAAATEKVGSRSSRTYEELLAATSDDTRELLDRVHELAQRQQLVITEGGTAARIGDI